MNRDDYPEGSEVVKDEEYEFLVKHGNEDFTPEPEAETAEGQPLQHELRDTHHYEGQFSEDETMMEGNAQETENLIPDDQREESKDRRLASLVAASHRKNRTPEQRRKSAEKASRLNEEIFGFPLEINDQGEVVTEGSSR